MTETRLCILFGLGFLLWEAERSHQRLLRLLKEKVSDLCFREITWYKVCPENTRKREFGSPVGDEGSFI